VASLVTPPLMNVWPAMEHVMAVRCQLLTALIVRMGIIGKLDPMPADHALQGTTEIQRQFCVLSVLSGA
jgi:hypothetical protein